MMLESCTARISITRATLWTSLSFSKTVTELLAVCPDPGFVRLWIIGSSVAPFQFLRISPIPGCQPGTALSVLSSVSPLGIVDATIRNSGNVGWSEGGKFGRRVGKRRVCRIHGGISWFDWCTCRWIGWCHC